MPGSGTVSQPQLGPDLSSSILDANTLAAIFDADEGALALSAEATRADGRLHKTVLDAFELSDGTLESADEGDRVVNGGEFFDLAEAQRIEHAYVPDPNFAVWMSGVLWLPRQIAAAHQQAGTAAIDRGRAWDGLSDPMEEDPDVEVSAEWLDSP